MASTPSFAHVRLLALLFLMAGCGERARAPEGAGDEPVHWSYGEKAGAEGWGALSPDFAVCETGTTQSPIDLVDATRGALPDLRFNYAPTPLEIENTGHTVQVVYQPGSAITVDSVSYELLQFHFHTPAEHQLRGKELPAELHLVHRATDGELAVVGVLIERGGENAALAPVWDHLPKKPGEERQMPSVRISAEELLPADRRHYRYAGSLTTPPCTEGVKWLVIAQPIEMSAEQIQALHSSIGTSNRPVQPLGSRELRRGT